MLGSSTLGSGTFENGILGSSTFASGMFGSGGEVCRGLGENFLTMRKHG